MKGSGMDSRYSDSLTIRSLRLPLALSIIFIHLHMQVSGTQIGWGRLTSPDAWRIFACISINELAAIAVPLFFMMSGYLFFYGPQRPEVRESGNPPPGLPPLPLGWWLGKWRRRVRTLLVPYVLFCLLAVVGLTVNHAMQGHTLADSLHTYLGNGKWLHNFWDVHTTGHNTNILGVTKPVSYPVCIPLWFIRDLMVIVLMSPLIHWAIRRLRLGWIALMAALSLTGIWIPLVGFSASTCLWFSIGAWYSIHGRSMAGDLHAARHPLLAAALPLLILDILTDGTPADRYTHFAFLMLAVPATYAITARAARPRQSGFGKQENGKVGKFEGHAFGSPIVTRLRSPIVTRLQLSNLKYNCSSALSFFIFAFHTLPIPFVGCRPVEWAKQVCWTGSDDGLLCIVQFLAAALLTAGICVSAWLLLQWTSPKILSLLTGRSLLPYERRRA